MKKKYNNKKRLEFGRIELHMNEGDVIKVESLKEKLKYTQTSDLIRFLLTQEYLK